MDENPSGTTIADKVLEVLRRRDREVPTKELLQEVSAAMETTPETVAQELTKMVLSGQIIRPRHGRYKLPESVEEQVIPSDAAIIIRHDKTNEIWITIKIQATVEVHDPINLTGGKGPTEGGDSYKGNVG